MRVICLLLVYVVVGVVARGGRARQKAGRAILDGVSMAGEGVSAAPMDVAPFATVEANATCGQMGAEDYCRQMPAKRGVVCGVCDGAASTRKHPPTCATDGDHSTWWQSPTLAQGEQFRHVTLTLTLPQMMKISHVIIKCGPSPRPLAWSLDASVSVDMDDWRMLRAFGDREHCRTLWGLQPERKRRRVRGARRRHGNAPLQLCSTQFASPRPLDNGEMHVSLEAGVVVRRVRLSLRGTHAAPQEQSYYTVRSIAITAHCLCRGTTVACAQQDGGIGGVCGECPPMYYSSEPGGQCVPCQCHDAGSRDGECEWDAETQVGVCHCVDGVGGHQCDRCLDGGELPHCGQRCKCDPRGIAVGADVCDPVCRCKERVVGERCDRCAHGHFGLSEGCLPCYCAGVTDQCTEHPSPSDTVALSVRGSVWSVTLAHSSALMQHMLDEEGMPYVSRYEMEGWQSAYWSSDSMSGDRVAWYGGLVHCAIYVTVERGDAGGKPLAGHDVLLVANDGTTLASEMRTHDIGGHMSLNVALREGGWQTSDGKAASRHLFMYVLANMNRIMLRAGYHLDQEEARLVAVEVIGAAGMREQCSCPPGYEGDSCTRCAWTHVAVPAPAHSLQCIPCDCNGHASCDAVSGACHECRHNTTGPNCSRCAAGHYGAPARGPCLPCACPLHEHSNNFSPNCALAAEGGDQFVCTQCPPGYVGDHCETCDVGHWGAPATAGGSCVPCECGGAACNRSTGDCVRCPQHADGEQCDACQEGYYLVSGECVPCECGAGALSAACDPVSGECACAAGWGGHKCGQCGAGNGDVQLGCPACQCGVAAVGAVCDRVSGVCECALGAAPPHCDTCLEHHYNLTTTGCIDWFSGRAAVARGGRRAMGGLAAVTVIMLAVAVAAAAGARCGGRAAKDRLKAAEKVRDKRTFLLYCCAPPCPTAHNFTPPPAAGRYRPYHKTWYGLKHGCKCSAEGSVSAACDIRTGQCRCKPHVTGRACDLCQEGYFGLHAGGCHKCTCVGGAACHPDTGKCACPSGVGGEHCDRCLPGYYGFGPQGCLPCGRCGAGEVCDPESGRCACPGRSVGAGCGRCAAGTWRHGGECVACRCGGGAVGPVCDAGTGQCKCRAGWSGRACSECAFGYFGPSCRPCGCKREGTADCDAATGLCPCDADGTCRCKVNVVGGKCAQCRSGTFAMTAGCPECFCFGRSVHCTQAGVTRTSIHAPPINVSLGDARARHLHADNDAAPHAPLYLELSEKFLGDRVTSYGGSLAFTVQHGADESEVDASMHPLVVLHGNHGLVLEYYQLVAPAGGTHRVRFHESLWHVRGTPRSSRAARGTLLIALSHLSAILLRVGVTDEDQRAYVTVSNVSMDTTLEGHSRAPPAMGVEMCTCPAQYAGHSCEAPAAGYWLPPANAVHHHSAAGTILITLHGDEALPCQCNNKSNTCDPHTGECQNCRDGTAGAHCEHCAPGHLESGGQCVACPCPERTNNFARACHVSRGEVRCLCRHGYEGELCERCSAGFYRRGAECAPCGCDLDGSVDVRCDEMGRCVCRAHATGGKCDKCRAHRTHMRGHACAPCDACSTTLLDGVQQLVVALGVVGRPSVVVVPAPALARIAANGARLRGRVRAMADTATDTVALNDDVIQDIENGVQSILEEVEFHRTEALRQRGKALSLNLESASALEEALVHKARVAAVVEELGAFAAGGRAVGAAEALAEGRTLLGAVRHLRLGDYLAGAEDVFESANVQSTTASEHKYRIEDSERRLRNIQLALETLHTRADDLNKMSDTVWDCGDLIASHREDIVPRLHNLTAATHRATLALAGMSVMPTEAFVRQASSTVSAMGALLQHAASTEQRLRALSTDAEVKEGILYNLVPQYNHKYLHTVQEHVKQLALTATYYKSILAGSMAAAGGGRQLAEVLTGAHCEASAALRSATRVREMVREFANTSEAVRRSQHVWHHALRLHNETQGAQQRVARLEREAERAWLRLRGLGWAERALGAGGVAKVGAAEEGARLAGDVMMRLRALLEEAAQVGRHTQYALRPRLQALRRHGDWAVGGAQELVWQSRGLGARARELGGALQAAAADRLRDKVAADRTLGPRFDMLRRTVEATRHAADTISIPLGPAAGGRCSRAYATAEWSPSVTRVSMAVSFESLVEDGPLLVVGDRVTLSVRNGTMALQWGAGAPLTHPTHIRRAFDDGDHQATSYKVHFQRVWDRLELHVDDVSVSQTADGLRGPPASGALWLGGTTGLTACVHSLHVDDRRVGLWNFVEQPADAKCTGCMQRWHSGHTAGNSDWAWFTGEGYAEVRRAAPRIHDPRQFSLRLSFRTWDHDAMLFMAKDLHNNRSISLYLRGCTVVFAVEYADGGRLELSGGEGEVCGGRVVNAQATRLLRGGAERGSLRVDGSETLGSPSPPVRDSGALPDMREARFWVGGSPPGEEGGHRLLGALGGLQVERVGYDLLDTSRRHGVTALEDAPPALRRARFSPGGYLELSAPALKRRAAIGLTFDALSTSGIILLRAPTNMYEPHQDEEVDQHYLAIWLHNCGVVLQCDVGRGQVRVATNASTNYTDERPHTIRVLRAHKQLELWVDDELVGSGALAGGPLNARPRGLFLGGVAPSANWPTGLDLAHVPRFAGTLADLIVDSQVIGMETSLRSAGAAIGRVHRRSVERPAAINPPIGQLARPACTESSSYTVEVGAVKFGDSPHSHAALRLPHDTHRGKHTPRTLLLSLQYRTFRDDGVLLLVPGAKSKPKHYSVLMLHSGKLKLVVRGRRRRELIVERGGVAGDWLQATVKVGGGGRVQVSGAGGETRSARTGRTMLGGRLYVGGTPHRDVLPTLPDSVSRAVGLVGCVRNVQVGGRVVDVGPGARGGGQCFPHVERAHHFSGDAHAAWTGAGSAPGEPLEVSVEFRTSAAHALLVARRDMLVEIRDGTLAVGGVNTAAGGGGVLCDDRWRVLHVKVEGGVVSARVVGGPQIEHTLNTHMAHHRDDALYIAGVPDGGEWGSVANMRGCVRSVLVHGAEVLPQLRVHNVLMDACPASPPTYQY